jgi:hypothetical protein
VSGIRPVLYSVVLVAAGCGRIWYDPIASPDGSAPGVDGARRTDSGVGTDIDAGATPDGSTTDGGVSGGTDGASATDAAGTDAPSSDTGLVMCARAGSVLCPGSILPIAPGVSGRHDNTTEPRANGTFGSCGGKAANEVGVRMNVTATGMYRLDVTATFDAIVYIRADTCDGTEVVCENAVAGPGTESIVLFADAPSTWHVFVDGEPDQCGMFAIEVNR